MQKLGLRGTFDFVHKDKNGKIIEEWSIENLITNEGKAFILDSAFNATALTDITNVFYFIIQTSGTAGATQTYATPVRTESSNYTESLRQTWGQGAASGTPPEITNASAATITADTGGITVTGIGLVCSPTEQTGGAAGDVDAKGDTTCSDGVLISTADVSKTLALDETLDITYTIST